MLLKAMMAGEGWDVGWYGWPAEGEGGMGICP